MGSYSLLQIVGSTIIGGLFILMLFRFNTIMVEKKHRYKTKDIVQNGLTDASNLISLDLNKIGYINDRTKAEQVFNNPIVSATKSMFVFKTDLPVDRNQVFGDGTVDNLSYFLGDSISSTPNPSDRVLNRQVDSGTPLQLNYGITKLEFKYYNEDGDSLLFPIAPGDLNDIKVIEYTITVQDIYGYNYSYMADSTDVKIGDTFYSTMSKTKKVAIKNIKGR